MNWEKYWTGMIVLCIGLSVISLIAKEPIIALGVIIAIVGNSIIQRS